MQRHRLLAYRIAVFAALSFFTAVALFFALA